MNTDVQHLGFIGLGTMGTPMCERLIAAGHRLFVQTRSKVPASIAAGAAACCPTARTVAEEADVIFLMVPDTPHVEEVLFGEVGLAAGLAPGKVVVDMSSISPVATKAFARRIEELGCGYLDAPVSGGEIGAKNGTLSIMVGGPELVFERVRPLFEAMGRNINRIGANGDGQTAKVANQIIVALSIQAVAEAMVFAAKAGADPERVRQALLGGFASSRVLEVHGKRMVERRFEPGFRIELHQKDLDLALSSARQLGVALQNTATAQQLFNACAALGAAGWDHSALVLAVEQSARVEVRQVNGTGPAWNNL